METDLNEELHVEIDKKYDLHQDIKDKISEVLFTGDEDSIINKKRALKRWKQSFGYFSLNAKKFEFSMKDL